MKSPLVIVTLAGLILAAYHWEARWKPVSQALYGAAVGAYQDQDYERSMKLLRQDGEINPIESAIPALFGWNFLRSGNYGESRRYFVR
ncbi:MAG: hypothetical protein HYS61_08320, partial [Acidobacteria bacterium]|nr:hypothetical protein [Acidobacteriota bacterium]